jgi:cell fate regulator YaaT (PSP1 superfamily)
MSKAEVTKPKQAKNKKYMLVRYSRMNTLGLFEHRETRIPKVSTRVVIKTGKGLELGCLVGQLSSYRAGQLKFDSDQIKKYFDDSNIDIAIEQAGKFVRYATPADISEERHLKKIAEEEMECCRRFIKELNLPMKIVDAEHIFGGERVIFYFMSDGRVDFRELVKKIAHEYQTRIEMRQIGSRDEAKILGDVESCGQQCCCQRFLKLLKPVNMRMAKMQKATLDPSKISGYCGRLKCCLRYEDKTYTELKKRLPKKNTRVKTKQGEGKVAGTQILTQLVMIESADGMRVAVPLEELEVISTTDVKKKKRNGAQNNHQQKNMENNTDSQAQYDEETLEQ